jgi:putative salt-induced outer membrane protein YdiY
MERKKGNTDTANINVDLRMEYATDVHRVGLSGKESYGENDGEKETDNGRMLFEYDRNLDSRFYVQASVAPEYDDIADVKYRVISGLGVGYYFIKKEQTRFAADIGPSYVVEEVGDDRKNYWALRLTWKARHLFENAGEIWFEGRYVPRLEDLEDYLLTAELGAEAPFYKRIGLRVVMTDNYAGRPAEDKKNNDFVLSTAVSLKF